MNRQPDDDGIAARRLTSDLAVPFSQLGGSFCFLLPVIVNDICRRCSILSTRMR